MTKNLNWNAVHEAVRFLKHISFDRLPPEWQQRILDEAFSRHPRLSPEVVLEKATQYYIAYVRMDEFMDFVESVRKWAIENGWINEDAHSDGDRSSGRSTSAAEPSPKPASELSDLPADQPSSQPADQTTSQTLAVSESETTSMASDRSISPSKEALEELEHGTSDEPQAKLGEETRKLLTLTDNAIARYALKRRLLAEAKKLGLTWTDIPDDLRAQIANRLANDINFRSKHGVKFGFQVDALMRSNADLLEWLTIDELDIALREFKRMRESLQLKPDAVFPRNDVEPIEVDWDKISRVYFAKFNAVLRNLVNKRMRQAGCYFSSREAEEAYLAANWFKFLTDEELEVIRRFVESERQRREEKRRVSFRRSYDFGDPEDAFGSDRESSTDVSRMKDDPEERKRGSDDGSDDDGGGNSGCSPAPITIEADGDDFAIDWSLGEIEFAQSNGTPAKERVDAQTEERNDGESAAELPVVSHLENSAEVVFEKTRRISRRKKRKPSYRTEIRPEDDAPVRVEPYAAEIALRHKLELEFLFWLVAKVLMGDRTKYHLSSFRWWLRKVATKDTIPPNSRGSCKTLLTAFSEFLGGKYSEEELRNFLNDERAQRRVLEEYRHKRRKGKQTIQSGRTLFDRILKRGNHIFWEINEGTHSFYLFGTARVLAALGRLEGRIPFVTHLVEIPAKYINRAYLRWLREPKPKKAKTYAKALLLYIALNRLYAKPQSTFDFARRFNMSRDTFYRLLKVAKDELGLAIERLKNYQVITQLSYEEGMFGFDQSRTYNEFGEMLLKAIDEGKVDIVWTANERLLTTGFCFYKDLNGKKCLIRQLPNSYRLKSFRLIFSRKTKMGVWHRLKDSVVSMLNKQGWRDTTGKLTIERFSELSAADRQWVLQAIRLGLVRADGWQIHRLESSLVGSESAKRFNRFECTCKNVRSNAQAKWQRLRELELAYKAAMWRRFGFQPPSMDSVVVSEPRRGEVVIWAETATTTLPVGKRIDLLVNGDDPEVVEALGAAIYQRYLPLSYLPSLNYARAIMPERLATALAKAFDAATVSPTLPLAVKAVHARSRATLFDRPDGRHFSPQLDAHCAHPDPHRPDPHYQRSTSAALSAPYARTVSDGDYFAFGYSALRRVAERMANAVRTSPQLNFSPPLSDLLVGQSEEKRSCAIFAVSRYCARKRAHESDCDGKYFVLSVYSGCIEYVGIRRVGEKLGVN